MHDIPEPNIETHLEEIGRLMLRCIEPDTHDRQGLAETPARFAKAWRYWTAGYNHTAANVLKCFDDGSEGYDEMVILRNAPFYSMCEHHMAPFFGTATIAYIPKDRIVGISKLSRLLDIHSRRLQVQERLTCDIADDLWHELDPIGVGVMISGRHMCMESRGIRQQGQTMITSALRGVIKEQPEARAEFLSIAS